MAEIGRLLKKLKVKKIWGEVPEGLYDVSTDSRSFKNREIFVALDGQNFKGIHFIEDIIKRDCPLIFFNQSEENVKHVEELLKKNPSQCFVAVDDTLTTYQEISRLHALDWAAGKEGRKIIGITGSNGKTTNKEMLYSFLEGILPGQVLCTEKNFNNHIGVPRTLLRLNDGIEIMIVEMGTNHPGEIPRLCELAEPDCGIITNIGTAHMEFFHSEGNIFKEKRSLFDAVKIKTKGRGFFVLNGDDNHLKNIEAEKVEGAFFVIERSEGQLPSSKMNAAYIRYLQDAVEVQFRGQVFVLKNPHLTGNHNFRNLASTFLLAHLLFPEKTEELILMAGRFRPANNRSYWLEMNGKSYFLDAYNANPSSMKESLAGFADKLRQKDVDFHRQIYILGDMNELGPYARQFHCEVAQFLEHLGAKNVAFLGRYASFYKEGLKGDCIVSPTVAEFKEKFWPQIQDKFQYFFIKGSRSLELESLLEGLAEVSYH